MVLKRKLVHVCQGYLNLLFEFEGNLARINCSEELIHLALDAVVVDVVVAAVAVVVEAVVAVVVVAAAAAPVAAAAAAAVVGEVFLVLFSSMISFHIHGMTQVVDHVGPLI